jgi:hypothetical protein
VSKAHDRASLDPGFSQRLEFLIQRHQEGRRLVRAHDARGMRVESQHERRPAPFGGHAPDALDDFAVTAMEAVEITKRQHRLMPARRTRIVWEPSYLHWRVIITVEGSKAPPLDSRSGRPERSRRAKALKEPKDILLRHHLFRHHSYTTTSRRSPS